MNHSLIEARRMLAAIGVQRVYFVANGEGIRQLTETEAQFAFGTSTSGVLAFTSPIADLLFSKFLTYEWQGRGFCCVFRRHPDCFTLRQVLGIVLHEVGHYLADCDNPCRDDTDHKRALAASWESLKSEREGHDGQWLRATIHAWWRANSLGWSIPLSETIVLEQYGVTGKQLKLLLTEARLREREPIEAILRSTASRAQASPKPAPASRQCRAAKWPRAEMIGGQVVKRFLDGSIETLPDLHGRGGGKKFASIHEFSR